jgi:hypothetical protein
MKKLIAIVTICFVSATLFSGCDLLQKLGLQNNNDEVHPVSSIALNEDEAKKLSDKMPIHIYFANEDNTKLRVQIKYVTVAEAKKGTNTLATLIVKEVINGPDKASGLKATIPSGTKLLSTVEVKNGLATVNLSIEVKTKHIGGKAAEQATIYSIVNSLTELKEIEKVKFLIEGKVESQLAGSFQFDQPFPRSLSLISKEGAVPSSQSIGSGGNTDSSKASPTVKDKKTTTGVEENAEDTYIDIEEDEMIE